LLIKEASPAPFAAAPSSGSRYKTGGVIFALNANLSALGTQNKSWERLALHQRQRASQSLGSSTSTSVLKLLLQGLPSAQVFYGGEKFVRKNVSKRKH